MWSGARRVTRAAVSPSISIATQLRSKSTVQLRAGSIQRFGAARQLAITHTRSIFTRKNEAVPIVQAIVVDKFGKQHTVQCKVKPTPRQNDAEDVVVMAKWAAALLATGACVAGTMGDNGQAHAASSSGSSNSDSDDLLEQLKKKVQAILEENKATIQNAMPSQMGDAQKYLDEFLSSGKGGQVSWGFLMGVCSGFAMKKVSKVGAVALGSVFILFQCASYAGYIDVNHKKIEKDVMEVLDINKDGVFDSKDVDDVYKKVMKVLEYSLPAGSGFALGFLVGFRAG